MSSNTDIDERVEPEEDYEDYDELLEDDDFSEEEDEGFD